MANDNKETKQNRSMFLYTALIFAVALVLIIIAFFGQKNIRQLRTSTNHAVPTAAATTAPEEKPDELALTANALSAAQEENTALKAELGAYKALALAYQKAAAGEKAEAETMLSGLDKEALTEEQKVLYEQTEIMIKKGKEQ